MVVRTVTDGILRGTWRNDVLTGIAQNGVGGNSQIHVYAGNGNDLINLDFNNIRSYSFGHHARGDADGSTNRGDDTFNFKNLHKVDSIVVGRIEDFDASRDTLKINGSTLTSAELARGYGRDGGFNWRIVEYDADRADGAHGTQQWLLIDTGQGKVFYTLEGARVTPGDGGTGEQQQEVHFVGGMGRERVTEALLDSLPTKGFVDPQNVVPDGHTPQGGRIINDDDNVWADAGRIINGTSKGDLIAAGLNNDRVHAGGGNDKVWGGTGNDHLRGDSGNDSLFGGTGNDHIVGGHGHDLAYGQTGNDNLYGWSGNDRMYGGSGNDRLFGHGNNDRLYGDAGNDVLNGSTGRDLLYGGSGNDWLRGGEGADRAFGGSGRDVFDFNQGELLAWHEVSGTAAQRMRKLDFIEDFQIGADRIDFRGLNGVDDMSDLRAWKTNVDGDMHFMLRVRDTNERLMVDVDDNVSWGQFFDSDNFIF